MGELFVIRVDVPALSDYVAYLRESRKQQAQIDAYAAQIAQLTGKLHTSEGGLKTSVGTAPKETP